MNLGNVKDEYNPGEEITCAAEGNPGPTIIWVDDNNDTVVESHILTIEASMEGTRTYSCLATNIVRGTTYQLMETITFNVTSKLPFAFLILHSFEKKCQCVIFVSFVYNHSYQLRHSVVAVVPLKFYCSEYGFVSDSNYHKGIICINFIKAS